MERRRNPQDVVNWTGAAIAILLALILAFVTYALVRWTIPTENENALMLLLGHLNGMVSVIVAFYFGSSSQAKKQADTIDTLAKTAQTAGTVIATAATPDALVIPPGASATATATPDGTVITPDKETP